MIYIVAHGFGLRVTVAPLGSAFAGPGVGPGPAARWQTLRLTALWS